MIARQSLSPFQRPANRLRSLHADERGTISIVSVFTLLLLTVLMGMVLNVGRQVDNKVKLQNAADAATYSGGVVLARGMNTIAFSNHLLCDVFSMTAILREARDRNAESLAPEILAVWPRIAPELADSGFAMPDRQPILNAPPGLKGFSEVGPAISDKVPLEAEMVRTYGEWMAATSETLLPVFEEILAQEMITQFQWSVRDAIPAMAQIATNEIAQTHGPVASRRAASPEVPYAVFWRTMVDPVGGQSESYQRTLPVVDPVYDFEIDQFRYQQTARQQREQHANRYLRDWNNRAMQYFDRVGKMSQFGQLWRGFTCGQLEKLLSEYPNSNLPYVIRYTPDEVNRDPMWIDQDYMFVGVAYRPQIEPAMGKVFKTSLTSDAQGYSQGMLMVRRGWRWDMFTQNWTFHIVPATHQNIGPILQTQPQLPAVPTSAVARTWTLPDLSNINATDIRRITTH